MVTVTYLAFHAIFVAPPLLGLSAVAAFEPKRSASDVRPVAVGILLVLALAYTTPWDNYLLARGVWSYGQGAVAASVWHAPVEEYLFVVLQSLVVALWTALVSARTRRPTRSIDVSRTDRLVGAVAGGSVGLAGALALTWSRTFYVGAILAWAGPVLALQWAVGWPYLLARIRTVVFAVAVPTVYFSLADAVAIDLGIWAISPAYTTGLAVGGLPVEEATFFLVTSLFLVQGLVLYPWVVDRWR